MIMFMKSVMLKTKIILNINIVDTLESAKVTISTLRHLRDDEQNLNNLIGSPPTYTNTLCEWLVITMKDNEL